MNGFYFGPSERQLFGAYDPPQGGGRRGVVLCYPWAREYLLAYPTIRQLARTLAAGGWHVLRFDYYGTGDSAGEQSEATRAQWLSDIGTAVDELKDVGQLSRVSLVGMRYGAALAAEAAATRHDVDRMVLWDPVVDGRSYLRELGVEPSSESVPDQDVLGVVLSSSARKDLESLTIERFSPGLPRTLVVDTRPSSGVYDPLVQRLREGGVDCSVEHQPDVPVWREEWGRGGVGLAVAAINIIAMWLAL